MDETNPKRLARLARALSRHPRHLGPYLRYLPAWGRGPIDVELPWIAFGAIEFLRNYLKPTHRVFEFGSGGSSLFLARRAAQVVSVENDAAWHAAVVRRAAARGYDRLRCELHPIDFSRPSDYSGLSYFQALQPAHDLIVVDGYCDYQNARHGILRHIAFSRALECVRRPGGVILVDDYWRFPEMADEAPEARLTVFESTGPCRYGATSTAVFAF